MVMVTVYIVVMSTLIWTILPNILIINPYQRKNKERTKQVVLNYIMHIFDSIILFTSQGSTYDYPQDLFKTEYGSR